jgi:enamine deaminase RidA (YjgF/YER057c/UK114 family)
MKKIIQPESLHEPANYSQGVLVKPGRLLFIAGQTALDADGNVVGIGDPAAQTRQIYENIGRILAEAGGSFPDLVKITRYMTDVSFKTEVNRIQKEYLKEDPPASTGIVVKGLAREAFLVEIEAIACIEK